MKKEKKRKLIAITVVAAILLSISTFIFIYYVPSLDSEIDKKQKEISILLDNQLIYQSYIQTVDLLTNQYNIAQELGYNSTQSEIILRRNLGTLLLYSHLVYLGEPPTTDDQDNWDSYDINQLVNENSRIQSEGEKQGKGIYKLPQMGEELSELGKRKSLSIGIGTGIQSFGFFLSTLAAVVGIHWEEKN